MKIGFDLDGVICDFNASFMDLMARVTGRDLFGFTAEGARPAITCWNYPVDQFGYSKEEFSAAWKAVEASYEFWFHLAEYPWTRDYCNHVDRLSEKGYEVYYITSRMGIDVKGQTEDWLNQRGVLNPTVLISSAKGLCAKALDLGLYVDDKNENVLDVLIAQPRCKVIMQAQPWNQQQTVFDEPDVSRTAVRANSRGVLDILEAIR